jgi:hypothetical protein
MLPYLAATIILIGCRRSTSPRDTASKLLAGAFLVSGMQFYFYLAKNPIRLM